MARAVPPENTRVTHQERQHAADWLASAFEDGCLTVDEFESRTGAVYAAMTRGDLCGLTSDLPAMALPQTAPSKEYRKRGQRRILRDCTTIWWLACIVSVLIWVLVCLGNERLADPWWIWVVGPGGALLATLWRVVDREE